MADSSELRLTVPGEPRSKARPKFTGRGKAYSDKVQRGHEERLEWHFRIAVKKPWTAGLEIGLVFFRSNRQRIDLDNLVKAVLDAATGIVWVDDVQIVNLGARLELDSDEPRTEIYVGPCSTSMPRGSETEEIKVCPTCGKTFASRSYNSKPNGQIYCSKGCIGMAQRECPTCHKSFKPRTSGQRFCSKPCGARSQATKDAISRSRRKSAEADCLLCGAELHRKNAVLCATCWLKHAPGNIDKEELRKEFDETGRIRTRSERGGS